MMRLTTIVAVTVCGMVGTVWGAPTDISIEVYPDGLAYVTAQFEADPQEPSLRVELLGSAVDNFVAVNGEGELLASQPGEGDSMALETFGASLVGVSYDIHDIVSKDGRIWTISLNVDYDYTLLMPVDSVIVGMNAIPKGLDTLDDRVVLDMPGEPAQIRYITNTDRSMAPIPPVPPEDTAGQADAYAAMWWVALPVAAGAAGAFAAVRIRARRAAASSAGATTAKHPKDTQRLDPETVFARMPQLREEDMEIVRHICLGGGEITESDLRKKIRRPKTTIWRAVQRLRREGVVDVIKRDLHNHIIIRHQEDEG